MHSRKVSLSHPCNATGGRRDPLHPGSWEQEQDVPQKGKQLVQKLDTLKGPGKFSQGNSSLGLFCSFLGHHPVLLLASDDGERDGE